MAMDRAKRLPETLTLAGPMGSLEAVLEVPPAAPVRAAVVAHPHPLYGGTMHNGVVVETARCLQAWGAVTLRFNFRGVGVSAGEYDHGRGEVDDLDIALDELHRRHPRLPLVLAGYSFGARVALERARRSSSPPLVAVLVLAPPLVLDDVSFAAALDLPVALVCGELDELTPPSALATVREQWRALVALELVAGAGHDLGTQFGGEALRRALGRALTALGERC